MLYTSGNVALDAIFTSCTLRDNIGYVGGALRSNADGSSIRVVQSTITGNSATEGGGAVYIERGVVAIQESVVNSNVVYNSIPYTKPGEGFFINPNDAPNNALVLVNMVTTQSEDVGTMDDADITAKVAMCSSNPCADAAGSRLSPLQAAARTISTAAMPSGPTRPFRTTACWASLSSSVRHSTHRCPPF